MSHSLSFETVNVNGKPAIFIKQGESKTTTTASSSLNHKVIDYKTRFQRYPIRGGDNCSQNTILSSRNTNNNNNLSSSHLDNCYQSQHQPNMASLRNHRVDKYDKSRHDLPQSTASTTTNRNRSKSNKDDEIVTLTSSQLAAILESVSHISSSSRRDSSSYNPPATRDLKIKIDKQGNKVNIEAISPRSKADQNPHSSSYNNNKRESHTGNNSYNNNKRPPPSQRNINTTTMNNSRTRRVDETAAAAGRNGKKSNPMENILSLLHKTNDNNNADGGRRGGERQHQQQQQRSSGGGHQQDEIPEDAVDALMKRIIAENKDKMSEEELVDLLSQVYIQAKQGEDPRELIAERHQQQQRQQQDHNNFGGRQQQQQGDDRDGGEWRDNSGKRRTQQQMMMMDNNNTGAGGDQRARRPDNLMGQSSPSGGSGGGPLTMAQKKRLQWDNERAEMANLQKQSEFDAANSLQQLRRRQNEHGSQGRVDIFGVAQEQAAALNRIGPPQRSGSTQNLSDIHRRQKEFDGNAMPENGSGSFTWGDEDSRTKQKEDARKLWLADLDAQRNEKRLTQKRDSESGGGGSGGGGGGGSSYSAQYQRVTSPGDQSQPQHRRGRGLANLAETNSQLFAGNNNHKPPAAPTGTRGGPNSNSRDHLTPPWLR